MSIVIGVVVVTTVSVFYLGKKGWHALHKMVGITPGVLIYQDNSTPLSLTAINWQQLHLSKKHLKALPNNQLHQLQRIDDKVSSYHAYQKTRQEQHKTPALTEQEFVLNKMLYTRLPEMLASHYQLVTISSSNNNFSSSTNDCSHQKKEEAKELLQEALNHIEQRLDRLLKQMEEQNLQALRVMNNYMNSHDS